MTQAILTRYLQPLLAGRRAECFSLIQTALAQGISAEVLLTEIVWPAMAHVDRLWRDDRINAAVESMACRINRTVADQLQASLSRNLSNGKRLLVCCADRCCEEIGAQMISDLFQADGWEVFFLGGAIPDDEVLSLVGQLRPQALLIFGTQPEDVPGVRQLIELIREIGVCGTMNIVVSGGIFNRADGLWQEVGADIFAPSARSVLQLTNELKPREPGTPRTALVKKRRRKRKLAGLAT